MQWKFYHIKLKVSLEYACWMCGHQVPTIPCVVASQGIPGWKHSVPTEQCIVFAEEIVFLLLSDVGYLLVAHLAEMFSPLY